MRAPSLRLPLLGILGDPGLGIREVVAAHGARPRTIVHVGAHLAQEMAQYVALNPDLIVWVEGDPRIFWRLEPIVARARAEHPGIRQVALNRLVADSDDRRVAFHRYNNLGASSSIFPGTERLRQRWPKVQEVSRDEDVPTSRLDTVLSEIGLRAEDLDCLVLDIQGAELLALKGAGRYLSFVRFLEVEVSRESIYDGGVLFDELDAYVTEMGFARGVAIPWHGDIVYTRAAPPAGGATEDGLDAKGA